MIIVASFETPMVQMLQLLTPDEMREVYRLSGAPFGAPPDEVIRSLARLTGATTLGLFAASTDDVLLDHVGKRLGMPPLLGGLSGIAQRERDILCAYFRLAWEAGDPGRKHRFLRSALACWDHPTLLGPGRPEGMGEDVSEGVQRATLEALGQTNAGLRALALAAAELPLELPAPRPAAPSISIRLGPISVVTPGGGGHAAMFGVLQVLWRARSRRLRDRRAQRDSVETHLAQLEGALDLRRRNLSRVPVPWNRKPVTGLSIAGGALTAILLQSVFGAGEWISFLPAFGLGVGSLMWAVASVAAASPTESDSRVSYLSTQAEACRIQLQNIERDILALEGDML